MNRLAVGRRLHIAKGASVLLVIGLAAAAAGIFLLPYQPAVQEADLIRRLSGSRINEMRFSLSSTSPSDDARQKATLSEAQALLFSKRNSSQTPRLQALVLSIEGELNEAAKVLTGTGARDSESLNDLGVIYWGLGKDQPSNFFKALVLFEHAAQLNPRAMAPQYNLVQAYRRLHLQELAERASEQYSRLESTGFLHHAVHREGPADLILIDDLKRSLQKKDFPRAAALLRQHRVTFKGMALELALNPPLETFDQTAEFALDYYGNSEGDSTLLAILQPMRGNSSQLVLNARSYVQQGVAAYFAAHSEESLDWYRRAQESIRTANSIFDELWIKLKTADTLWRAAHTPDEVRAAEKLLDEVVEKSRERRLDWLLGQALVSKGPMAAALQTQDQSLAVLEKAIDTLNAVDSPGETARPYYYLSSIYASAGDSENSLSLAYRALAVANPKDFVRLAQLYRIGSLQTYRLGFPKYALPLANQAVAAAIASPSGNPGVIASTIRSAATIEAAIGDYESADAHLKQAQGARDQLESPQDRDTINLELNLLCSQIKVGLRKPLEAEACLNGNLQILTLQHQPPPDLFSQTLLQLAQLSEVAGEDTKTRDYLQRAVKIIEQNDEYFRTPFLRMPFENQRRNLYDACIVFEYDRGDRAAAWSYVQRYRSKLFLEFLRQMNPGVVLLDEVVDRSKVQQLIPEGVQTIEYVLLKDRLLIWLVSRDKFKTVSVPIHRDDLEKKVSTFVEFITAKKDVQTPSEELYNLLIEPIASELDPERALAIIPDLALHRLNFTALYSREANKYLIEQYPIVESPNLTTFLLGGSTPPPGGQAIFFGAQQDDTNAKDELRSLEKIYADFKTFNGTEADKPEFLTAMGNASVFHFAGHSQDASDPFSSSILLDGDREGPNSVTALDISRRRMPENAVVVLASCDSSVGNSRDGIGMRGLTSAFLISGAGSVVGSLWLVEASNTSRLVVEFHKNFASLSVADSLREAQLKFIKEHKQPYYWSGFVVTGNTTAFRKREGR